MYRTKNRQWLKHFDFLILDCLSLVLCQILVSLFMERPFKTLKNDPYSMLLVLLILLIFVTELISQPHQDIIQRGYILELVAILKQYIIFSGMLITCLFALGEIGFFYPFEIIAGILISLVVNYILRLLLKSVIRQDILRSDKRNKMVLISTTNQIPALWKEMTTKCYPSFRIVAIALTDITRDKLDSLNLSMENTSIEHDSIITDLYADQKIQLLCGMDEANRYILRQVVDEIFLDTTADISQWNKILVKYCDMGITVHLGIPGLDFDYPNRIISNYGNRLAITSTLNTAPSWKLSIKRIFDILGACVGLVITGLACLFVIPSVLLSDPGPIFFKQTRIGRNGRPFTFYKFRSMYTNAEERKKELMEQNEMSGFMFKLENDPRIIGSEKGPGKGYGNFIRRTSIDELPQFWNVLKGDMSLVGTRPPTQNEYEQYESHHKARLSMRPGITGMWQVSGRSDITDFEEVVKLDLSYIESWSLALDLKLLFKTVISVLNSNGAK